jgi:hypothetical protein
LRGLTTAGLGKGADVTFIAGSTTDVDPPLFGGVRALSWDALRVNDDCTDTLEDRFVFDLSLDHATDDGGKGMLALLVFQSKGGSASTSPTPVLVQRFPDSNSPVRVLRSIDSAVGNVCFAALARDGTGRISNSADHEVCVTTVRPPFFYGCVVSGGRGANARRQGGTSDGWIVFLAFAEVARRRARQRGRRA